MSDTIEINPLEHVQELGELPKKEWERLRKKEQRKKKKEALSLLSVAEKEKAILEAKEQRKVYDATAYQNKKRKAEALKETAPTIEPARRKHDRAYSQRKAAAGAIRTAAPKAASTSQSAISDWNKRPLLQRLLNNQKKKNNRILAQNSELKRGDKASSRRTANSAKSKEEKRRFLIEVLKLDKAIVDSFDEYRLEVKYAEMHERYLAYKGQNNMSHSDIVASIIAESINLVGTSASGGGYFAMEDLIGMAAREFTFSKEKMVEKAIMTTCNFSNMGEISKCQENLDKGDSGIMYQKATYVQAGLDAYNGVT